VRAAELTAHPIDDTTLGGAFVISHEAISPDGDIEYLVTDPSGKTYDHIPQELLVSWKKTLELEKKVRQDLEQKITTVQEGKRSELRAKRLELEKQLAHVYAHLPEMKE